MATTKRSAEDLDRAPPDLRGIHAPPARFLLEASIAHVEGKSDLHDRTEPEQSEPLGAAHGQILLPQTDPGRARRADVLAFEVPHEPRHLSVPIVLVAERPGQPVEQRHHHHLRTAIFVEQLGRPDQDG